MSKKLNFVNDVQGMTAENNRGRRGKNKSTAVQSHVHVAELETQLAIEKALGRERRKSYRETLKAVREVQSDCNRTIETVCAMYGQSMTEIVQAMGRNYSQVNGAESDRVAEAERAAVAEANSREVAHALHDPDEYTAAEAAADSTVKPTAKKPTAKKSTAKKSTAKKSTTAKKTAAKKTAAKKTAAKKTETVKAEKKATTAKKSYRKAVKRKVEMTDVHTVIGKNGVEYTVGKFTRTDNQKVMYGVWIESQVEDFAAARDYIKEMGAMWSGYASAYLFNELPDRFIKSGKATKKSVKLA